MLMEVNKEEQLSTMENSSNKDISIAKEEQLQRIPSTMNPAVTTPIATVPVNSGTSLPLLPPGFLSSIITPNLIQSAMNSRMPTVLPQNLSYAMPTTQNMIPSQVWKILIPNGENGAMHQVFLQDATPFMSPAFTLPTQQIVQDASGNTFVLNTNAAVKVSNGQLAPTVSAVPTTVLSSLASPPRSEDSMPLKKRHRRYDDNSAVSGTQNNNGHVSSSTSESDEDELSHSKSGGLHSGKSGATIRSAVSLQTQQLQEAKFKNMTQEEIKRERNRLAADRCRKKKLQKIDQLSDEVKRMEKQRSQILFQLDSLRHAALATRDTIRSHKTAGCNINDEGGALHRLIEETEALDRFVKSQL